MVFAALVVIFFPTLATLQSLPAAKDTLTFSYPAQVELARALRAGHFPLWSSNLNSPLFAEGQGGFAHPLALALFGLLPPAAAANLFLLLHVYAGLIFTYLLCRELGQSRGAAALAAPAFALGGFFLARMGIYTIITNGIWLPGLLWLGARYGRTGNLRWALAGALGGACALLAGQFQLASFAIVAATIYAAVKAGTWKRGLLGGAVFLIVPLALAAVQLVPTFELWRLSSRAADARPGDYSFWPAQYLSLLLPDFFGRAPHPAFAPLGEAQVNNYWGRGSFWESAFYLGAAPLVLAAVGLAKKRRLFFLITGALALLFATGTYTPLFKLYEVIPPFALFRAPSRLLIYAAMALAVAAGDGLDWFLNERKRFPVVVAAAALVAAVALAGAFRLSLPSLETYFHKIAHAKAEAAAAANPAEREAWRDYYTSRAKGFYRDAGHAASLRRRATWIQFGFLAATLAVLALAYRYTGHARVAAAALFLITAADLYHYNRGLTPTVAAAAVNRPPPVGAAFAAAAGERVYSSGYDLGAENQLGLGLIHENCHALWGYRLLVPRASLKEAAAVNVFQGLEDLYNTPAAPGGNRVPWPTAPRLDAFSTYGIRYFVRLAPWYGGGVRALGRFGPYYAYDNEAAAPPARAVHSYVIARDDASAWRWISDGLVDTAATAVLAIPPADIKPQGGPPTAVTVARSSPMETVCRLNDSAASLLILNDLYYPGWEARIDGRPTPILRANIISRAVAVPAGEHVVSFKYRPRSFALGLSITAGALLLTIILFFVAGHRRPHPREAEV